jgi:hypothetical protein
VGSRQWAVVGKMIIDCQPITSDKWALFTYNYDPNGYIIGSDKGLIYQHHPIGVQQNLKISAY